MNDLKGWHIRYDGIGGSSRTIRDEGGRTVAVAHLGGAAWTKEDAENRATLIAAAPELAEALRIFEDAYQTGRNEPLVIASEHAREVLARLEGK